MEGELRYPQGDIMALKFPRHRVRNSQTHNAQDMNDAILPVVEEMGRLNEHNFSQQIKTELTVNDMEVDVAFNLLGDGHFIDVSDKGTEANITAAGTSLFTIPQNNRWVAARPTTLSKSFTSKEGGMFRILASGQWGSERITKQDVSSYLRFCFKVDGAIIPDSIIGDQDFSEAHVKMENGQSGQLGAFLLDFTMYLHPGAHIVELMVQNLFLKDAVRAYNALTDPVDAYLGSVEIFIWEMHR